MIKLFERSRRRNLLDEWYRTNWPDLYRFVYHHVQNRQDAEDLAQEAFSRTLAHHSADEPPTRQYLYTTAHNLIRDRWRRRLRTGVAMPLEEALLAQAADDEAIQLWVGDLLAKLPQEYRTVLELRIIAGYSREETARRLNTTDGAVRSMQYRALQLLRTMASDEMEVAK
ncbi:MAG: polymerase sigma factor [Symbiobacteriaceae bacterium]|jgi:RNA polymerase sigma-70 factor (ECF subfamily)|nr:polymerase sigma factor [Symbiobacteriaceae bacterium]